MLSLALVASATRARARARRRGSRRSRSRPPSSSASTSRRGRGLLTFHALLRARNLTTHEVLRARARARRSRAAPGDTGSAARLRRAALARAVRPGRGRRRVRGRRVARAPQNVELALARLAPCRDTRPPAVPATGAGWAPDPTFHDSHIRPREEHDRRVRFGTNRRSRPAKPAGARSGDRRRMGAPRGRGPRRDAVPGARLISPPSRRRRATRSRRSFRIGGSSPGPSRSDTRRTNASARARAPAAAALSAVARAERRRRARARALARGGKARARARTHQGLGAARLPNLRKSNSSPSPFLTMSSRPSSSVPRIPHKSTRNFSSACERAQRRRWGAQRAARVARHARRVARARGHGDARARRRGEARER